MNTALLLAWRYLSGRLLRTALTTLAVVFGVMIMFGMQGVIPAVRASFDANLAVAAHGVDLIVTRPDGSLFTQATADDVAATPGVALVMAVLERPLRLPAALALSVVGAEQPINALTINGVDPATAAAAIPIAPVEGRWFGPGEERVALVRQTLLEQTGLALGDTLRLPAVDGVVEVVIVGVLPPRPVFGDEEVYIPLATAQALFGLEGQINALVGQFVEGQDAEALRGAILTQLGPAYTAGAVEAGGAEWDAVLRIGEAAFLLFGGLALVMGGFSILNTFRTGVAERRRDIGMLRAVGASRQMVVAMVVAESLLIGVAGTILGILAGYSLVSGLLLAIAPGWERAFGAPMGAPSFSPQAWAISVGLGLGVPLLSGLLPALAAGRLTPMEVLRPADEATTKTGGRGRLMVGAALLGLALLGLLSGEARLALLGALLCLAGLVVLAPLMVLPLAQHGGRLLALVFPREGGIAQGNLLRNPGRAAVTASAMLISLAILVALAGLSTTFTRGLLGYLEQSIRADYMLAPEALVLGQGNIGASPDLAARLRATPGIAAVTTLRQTSGRVGETEAQLVGIDPATYPELAGLVFTAGEPATAYAQLAEGAVIVNGVLATQAGVEPGDNITIETLDGPQEYIVAGVGLDYLNSRVATAYLSQAELDRALGPQRDALLLANRDPEAEIATVEAALLELARDYPAFSLISFAQWREEQVAGNQTRTNILYVLMAALAIPSLIALANTLGINVLERTRELGVLRAIGATRGQVQRMIIAESLLLAALGVLGGAVAGVGLGYALVGSINQSGLSFPYTFPAGGIALASLVGLLFAVLAALLPARRAARLDIIAALRWE